MIEQLNQIFESGLYLQLHKAGLMPSKISNYRDYYLYVDAQIKTRGLSKRKAILEASVIYGIDERIIWRALKALGHKSARPKKSN